MKHHTIHSIVSLHETLSLPAPAHPLISFINLREASAALDEDATNLVFNVYMIIFQKNPQRKIRYGQSYFNFEKGELVFIAPGQVVSPADSNIITGCTGLAFPSFFYRGAWAGEENKTVPLLLVCYQRGVVYNSG
jgi:AraC family transcriptional regulator, transcriptional activator of pobA